MRETRAPLARASALMKIALYVPVAVILVGVGFYGGYTVANYRAANEYLPAAQRFSALSLSSFMLRSVEMIDANATSSLRAKLLAVSKMQIEPLQHYAPTTLWNLASSPGLLKGQAEALEELNEAELEKQRSTLRELQAREK